MALSLDVALLNTRTIFGEVDQAAFSDQQIVDWLSLGQQAVAAFTLGLQKHAIFANTDTPAFFVAGLREYAFEGSLGSGGLALPTAIRVVQIYLNGQDLPLWTAKMVPQADPRARHAGAPQYWYHFGRAVGFAPCPSAAFVAGAWTIDMIYADLPAEWTTGPSVLFQGLDELPTYYAVTRMLLARRQWQRASQIYNQFLMLLQQYRQRATYEKQSAQGTTCSSLLDRAWESQCRNTAWAASQNHSEFRRGLKSVLWLLGH